MPVLYKEDNEIATITLNRPEACNALNAQMIEKLHTVLETIDASKTIRVVLLQGKGKHFCAGADLAWMQQTNSSKNTLSPLANLFKRLNTLNKPTISVIHGKVYGGGLGLVACSDIAFCGTQTQFCLSEVKLGLIPALINPYLAKAIHTRPLRRFALTAELFSAKTALDIGLVHELCPENTLQDKALSVAAKIKETVPEAVAKTKAQLHTLSEKIFTQEIFEQALDLIETARNSPEAQRALIAWQITPKIRAL